MSKPQPDSSHSLYAKREKVYPREVHGKFAFWRVTGVITLLGVYYILPWLQWAERQAVLFDLPGRKFYIMGLTFWPQDFIYLALILIIAAVSLFFFTALYGRVWCGFACPQTVWTEVFLWMERKIEGDRSRQMKLDAQGWNRRKILIKFNKHAVWIVFSLFTGFTFVGYFTPIRDLSHAIINFTMGPWEVFWLLFYSFATYGNAGWMREQVCIYMCPYARFQSAMFDKDTLIISYDNNRGEPRGSRARGIDFNNLGLGSCIDCKLCVQVCPTGIDIRKGLQYECIACAACVDVCNDVMQKMHYPPNLIRYTTENRASGAKARLIRPRTIVYSTLLIVLLSVFFTSITQRIPLQIDVIRDRRALYRETADAAIENVYTIKIMNMENKSQIYRLTLDGLPDATLNLKNPVIAVPAGEVIEVPAWIRIQRAHLDKKMVKIRFKLTTIHKPEYQVSQESRFFGP